MPRVLTLAGAFACLLVAAAWTSRPASAEYCGAQMPEQVRFARGYTFIGTLEAKRRGGAAPPSWDFRVERIFAGADRLPSPSDPRYITFEAGEVMQLDGRCYPPRGLRIGTRYLVSDATLATFASMSTVVWEVLPHDRVRLLRQYGSRRMVPRLAQPTTVAEAVALMAPGANLPETDVVATGEPAPAGPWEVVVVLLGACIGSAMWLRRIASR